MTTMQKESYQEREKRQASFQIAMAFRRQVIRSMKKNQITQARLAKEKGITRQAVYLFLHRKSRISYGKGKQMIDDLYNCRMSLKDINRLWATIKQLK